MNIITKYCDYTIHPIEFFIKRIRDELSIRDLPGLTNDLVQKINIMKEHPLVVLIQRQLETSQDTVPKSSNLVPAIGVTPGNPSDEGVALNLSPQTFAVNEKFIEEFDELREVPMKERVSSGVITDKQIYSIKKAYELNPNGTFCSCHKKRQREEVSISLWTETSDMDIILSNLLESIFDDILAGFWGDKSEIKNMKFSQIKGLTNFNFGRVLYGTEYNVSFTNTKNNYMIFSEDRASEVRVINNTRIAGDENE